MSIVWALLKFSNPVTGLVMTAVGWVWKAVSYFFRGVFSFMQNPLELFAVICIAVVVFCLGVMMGIRYDVERVKQAKAELARVYQDMSQKDYADAQRAAEARVARKAEEDAERARQANTAKLPPLSVVAPVAGAVAVPSTVAPAGVRNKPNKVRRGECQQGLFGCL
jgi:hypothetical protein